METFIYIVLGIIAFIVILALIAPKSYAVSRSIEIKRPLSEVFDYLKYLKNQDSWSPWFERDPDMKKKYSGNDGDVGFVVSWDSDHKQVGSGEQEIIKIVENESIETQLRFLKPFKSTSDAYLKVQGDETTSKVIWGFSGKNKFPVSIMMLFMNMDKAVGNDFEQGLAKLKSILEK